MVEFNEEEHIKKLQQIRSQEEEDLARVLSEKYGVSYADLSGIGIDTDALKMVPEETSRENEVALFDIVGKKLALAARSPQKESTKKMISELQSKGYEVTVYMVSQKSLEKAWGRYKDINFTTETSVGLLDISNEEIESFVEKHKTPDEVRTLIQEVLSLKKGQRVTRIVETIVAGGIALSASDVHIEPQDDEVEIRMRLDGILVPFISFDYDTYKLLLSRVKLLSGLKLNITENAQDGRFSIHIADTEIEIRTSILPGNYGESIVLRILNPDTISLELSDLGMSDVLQEQVKKDLARPNGMILNTGPTGSGKTTTLYAFLKHIYKPGIKIITIEDPIEYHLEGITQTQVDRSKGYTFLEGLRSALRQDPDVIMVGEIRDEETAKTAVNAALTGHLVLSTLHTNNASGTFPRLVDLGVNPHTLGSALQLVIAQRLVRKIRPECKTSVPTNESDRELIQKTLNSLSAKDQSTQTLDPLTVSDIKNECASRDDGGYSGRVGIFEAIHMDTGLEELLKNSPGEREVAQSPSVSKNITLQEDGVRKVLEGVTTLEELRRVVDVS